MGEFLFFLEGGTGLGQQLNLPTGLFCCALGLLYHPLKALPPIPLPRFNVLPKPWICLSFSNFFFNFLFPFEAERKVFSRCYFFFTQALFARFIPICSPPFFVYFFLFSLFPKQTGSPSVFSILNGSFSEFSIVPCQDWNSPHGIVFKKCALSSTWLP